MDATTAGGPARGTVARLKGAIGGIPDAVKLILQRARTEPKARVQLAFIALGVALVLGVSIYGIYHAAHHGGGDKQTGDGHTGGGSAGTLDPSTTASTAGGGSSLSGSPLAPTSAYPFVTFHAGTLNCDAAAWTWISRHNQLPPTDPAYIDPRKWVWDKASSKWYSQGGTSYVVLKYAGADPSEYEAVQQKAATAFVGCAGDPSNICLTNARQNPCLP